MCDTVEYVKSVNVLPAGAIKQRGTVATKWELILKLINQILKLGSFTRVGVWVAVFANTLKCLCNVTKLRL